MTITINIKNKSIQLSNEQFPMTFQEAGFISEGCKTIEDFEDQANDWANDKELMFDKIIVE